MLCEQLGLAVRHFGRLGFERLGDPRVQLLPCATKQAAVRRVLHQRVLETVDRIGRRTALKHQLGGDEPAEGGSQLVLVKTGNNAQQRVRKLASNRGTNLRHPFF
jgi:hypothetical protein